MKGEIDGDSVGRKRGDGCCVGCVWGGGCNSRLETRSKLTAAGSGRRVGTCTLQHARVHVSIHLRSFTVGSYQPTWGHMRLINGPGYAQDTISLLWTDSFGDDGPFMCDHRHTTPRTHTLSPNSSVIISPLLSAHSFIPSFLHSFSSSFHVSYVYMCVEQHSFLHIFHI